MTELTPPDIPRETNPNSSESSSLPFDALEERYRREAGEIRTLTSRLHEMIDGSQRVLEQLAPRPWYVRLWRRISGTTARLTYQNEKNHLALQHTNLVLTAAVARQNHIIMEGMRVTLEKMHAIEQDAAALRAALHDIQSRRAAPVRCWHAVTRPFVSLFRRVFPRRAPVNQS